MAKQKISALFLDIGGVLLSDGWDHKARCKAVKVFHLNKKELDERHNLTFHTYEEGKMTLSNYLKEIVFYKNRAFTQKEFTQFMFRQSHAHGNVIDYFKEIKKRYSLRIIALSNEGRELNAFRFTKFKLTELFDACVSSSFVHLRKPDADIFQIALDVSLTEPDESLYIDDRLMFVEVARMKGMHGIHYKGFKYLKAPMHSFGLSL